MSMRVGDEFAGFQVVRRLGAGGMGEVYLVQHPRLPRQEALKILPHDLSGDESYRVRFNREADTAATLFHPNIVGVHDRGEADGKLWISMDYVEGTDLDALVRDRHPAGLPLAQVVSVIAQIAGALDHAHAKGLIHRDIKPANILLAESGADATGRVLLADFGIARRMDDVSGLTATNMAVGTVSFAAPEQLADDDVDGRADQYALAATALTLLTGRSPFAGTTPGAVMSRKMRGDVPRAAESDPRLAPLDRALTTAMATDPARRFRTCADFARALESEARYVGAPGPVSAPTVTAPPPSLPTPPPVRTPPPYQQATVSRPQVPTPTPAPTPSYFVPPQQPPAPTQAPTSMPGQVIAAVVVLGLVVLFDALMVLATVGSLKDGIDVYMMVTSLIGAIVGVVAAVQLLRRARSAPVVATVAAVLMAFNCVGLLASVAVPLLVWPSARVRAWFAR